MNLLKKLKKYQYKLVSFFALIALVFNIFYPAAVLATEEIQEQVENMATVEESDEESATEEDGAEEESSEEQTSEQTTETTEEENEVDTMAQEPTVEEEDNTASESEPLTTEEPTAQEPILVEELVAETSTTQGPLEEEQSGEILEGLLTTREAEEQEESPVPVTVCLAEDTDNRVTTDVDWNFNTENKTATTTKEVELGVKYVFPGNEDVSVTFTCLPVLTQHRSPLKIQEVKVSDLNLPETHKLYAEFAYDITTDMEDGVFEFVLTLSPPSEDKDPSVEVAYIEKSVEKVRDEGVTPDDVVLINEDNVNVHSDFVEVEGIDHMTIFLAIDSDGANDEPGQKDLTQMYANDELSPNSVDIEWNWDDTAWSGNNTGDGCALFDTNGDGLVEYSLCVIVSGNPASYQSKALYSCSNGSAYKCTNPVSETLGAGTSCTANVQADDPFPTGEDYPNDTVAECTVAYSDVGGSSAELVDVCSYPSGRPNSDPSDCVNYRPDSGKLEILKQLVPADDSGLFNLQVDGVTEAADVGNDGTTGELILDVATYEVGETAGTGTSLENYTTTIECKDLNGTGVVVASAADAGPLSVDLENDADVVCTITNTLVVPQGSITLDKVTVPGQDPTSFDFVTTNLPTPENPSLTDQDNPIVWANLADNTYTITENVPDYWALTAQCISDGTASIVTAVENGVEISLANGENVSCEFTNTALPRTGDLTVHKFVDKNANGVKDGTDSGYTFGNVTMYLYSGSACQGAPLGFANTDGSGNVSFSDLTAGAYSVREDMFPWDGWSNSTPLCQDVSVVAGETAEVQFGNVKLGQINVCKYEDLNGDGLTTGDARLGGWTINLSGPNNYYESLVTDDRGCVAFSNLAYGNYTFSEDMQDGWYETIPAGGRTYTYAINYDNSLRNLRITNFHYGAISGYKFNDLDGNGVWDQGEPALSGWTIRLDKDANGSTDDTTLTDANGYYVFEDLVAATYRVREQNQAGWMQTTANPANIALQSGSDVQDVNFGNIQTPAKIVAYKIVCENEEDLPNWGLGGPNITETTAQDFVAQHPGCHFEENWVFQWGYSDAPNPGDNTGESADPRWFSMPATDVNGMSMVEITELNREPNLWFREAWDSNYIPFTYEQADDNSRNKSAEVYCHTDVVNYDNWDRIDNPEYNETYYCIGFNVLKTGFIKGGKFFDVNSNGVFDDFEEADPENLLNGWTMYLYDTEWNLLATTETGTVEGFTPEEAKGRFRFNDLPFGSYIVCEEYRTGWDQTAPSAGPVDPNTGLYCHTEELGESPNNLLFGNSSFTDVHGYKWNDRNGDGVRQTCQNEVIVDDVLVDDIEECVPEELLPDWKIFIDENDNQTHDEDEEYMYTDGGEEHYGWYWFENLTPGTYTICEELQEGWEQTYPVEPSCHEVTVPFNYDYDCNVDDEITPQSPALVATDTRAVSLNAVCAPEYNFGNTAIAELFVTKDNDSWPTEEEIGNEVEYTITVEAKLGPVKDVVLTDLLPEGFDFIEGSWTVISSIYGDISGSLADPVYASPGVWNLGDLEKDEKLTITYSAKILEGLNAGIYPDMAYAQGETASGEEILAQSDASGFPVNNGILDETFVGTQVALNVPGDPAKANVEIEVNEEEVEGEVLGASTLPATGANTAWVKAALALLTAGALFVVFGSLVRRKRNDMLTKVIIIISSVLVAASLFTANAHAASLTVRLEEPSSPTNEPFELSFVVLDVLNRPVTVDCQVKKPGESDFNTFEVKALAAGGDTSTCNVDESVLSDTGTFEFRVTASAGVDEMTSDAFAVEYDDEKPSKPDYIKKDKKNDCKYEVDVQTADDHQTEYVEIYRAFEKEFDANGDTRIKTVTLGSDEHYEFDDELYSDCGKTPYYAVRAFDSAGNASSVRVEEVTETTTVEGDSESSTTEEETAGAVEVSGGSTTGGGTGSTEGTGGTEGAGVGVPGEEGQGAGVGAVLGDADKDTDLDGLFDNVDLDIDGDGLLNEEDDDVDGDGILNDLDPDFRRVGDVLAEEDEAELELPEEEEQEGTIFSRPIFWLVLLLGLGGGGIVVYRNRMKK